MRIKQTILTAGFTAGLFVSAALMAQPAIAAQCGGAETSIIQCSQGAGDGKSTTDNGVWALLILTLNILTAGVGIAAVGGIAYGAALYASSADKPDQAKAGITFIKNVVIGLVAYGLMFILLNFLIPGGIFS